MDNMTEKLMSFISNNHLSDGEDIFTEYFLGIFNKIFDPVPVPIILIDKEAVIRAINTTFCDYLQFNREDLIGKHVAKVDKNTRFPYVLKTKKAEIAYKHRFENGHTAIVHRIPVLDSSDEVLYGFGMVLFQDIQEFREIIEKNKQLHSELFHIKSEFKRLYGAKYSWETIIGSSAKIVEAKYMGRKAALTNSNVLLLGESGTGKELFAHAVHNDSGRGDYSFIRVNCAAIPSELLEAELFGYEEGAFTGARKGGKIGKFELANNGTIFLDEIGDMPLDMQAKLLRVLQEREVERIGGHEAIQLDVRVIAATNKNLIDEVKKGQFREDLYYRLHVMTLQIPSLRERMDDMDDLTNHLIEKLSNQIGKYVTGIHNEALNVLKAYDWPGNIRELENVLERAINMSDSDVIKTMHLPLYLGKRASHIYSESTPNLRHLLEAVEKQAIHQALEESSYNRAKAARALGISRSSLYEKLEKHNIQVG